MALSSIAAPTAAPGSPVEADIVAARRWQRALRRIDLIIVEDDHAILVGVGHRTPVRRRISLPTAKGLRALGVPTLEQPGGAG